MTRANAFAGNAAFQDNIKKKSGSRASLSTRDGATQSAAQTRQLSRTHHCHNNLEVAKEEWTFSHPGYPPSFGFCQRTGAFALSNTFSSGILSGEEGTEDIVVINIGALTLGIETTGGVFTKLIPRNTVILTHKSQMFVIIFLASRLIALCLFSVSLPPPITSPLSRSKFTRMSTH